MDAPPTPTGLAPGEVGLYLAFSGRSNSEPFRLPNGERITLERSSRGIALFRPDSGEQTLIDTYSSPSYSRSAKRPYVLDGRLFIVRHWTDSKRQDYTELDPATHRVLSTTTGGGRSDDEVYAIVGDEVFFLTSPRFEPIGPSAKPRLKRMPLGPDSFGNDVVLNEDAGFFHGGTLLADAGNLYWATKQEDELGLYEVSQTTEDVTPIDLFRVLDAEDSMSWSFAAADGVFYWAVLRTDRHVELWRYDPSAGGSPAVLDEVLLPPEVSPFGARIDADDGHLAVWLLGQPDGDSQFILYDPETASSRIVDTGLRVFGFQVSRG